MALYATTQLRMDPTPVTVDSFLKDLKMIIQAIDGKYYRDPFFVQPKWCLDVNDHDGITIKKTGSATWSTARRHAKEGGVKCRFSNNRGPGSIILGGRLVPVSIFEVELKAPIPIPTSHDGVFSEKPVFSEHDLEEVLSWI